MICNSLRGGQYSNFCIQIVTTSNLNKNSVVISKVYVKSVLSLKVYSYFYPGKGVILFGLAQSPSLHACWQNTVWCKFDCFLVRSQYKLLSTFPVFTCAGKRLYSATFHVFAWALNANYRARSQPSRALAKQCMVEVLLFSRALSMQSKRRTPSLHVRQFRYYTAPRTWSALNGGGGFKICGFMPGIRQVSLSSFFCGKELVFQNAHINTLCGKILTWCLIVFLFQFF